MVIFCFSNENTPASKNIVKKSITTFHVFFEEINNYRNSYQLRIERSRRSQIFFQIGVLGVLGLKPCKFIKKRLQRRCFIVKFAKFLENLFYRTPPVAASELISTFWSCMNTCFVFVE